MPNQQNETIDLSDKQQQLNRSAAIMHAVECESAFKMYSYRIIDHEQYIARITELVQLFNNQIK